MIGNNYITGFESSKYSAFILLSKVSVLLLYATNILYYRRMDLHIMGSIYWAKKIEVLHYQIVFCRICETFGFFEDQAFVAILIKLYPQFLFRADYC